MKKRFILSFLFFSFFTSSLFCQVAFDFKGHLKDLRYFSLDTRSEQAILENQLENRLEFALFFQEWGSLVLQARNIFFYGERVFAFPNVAGLKSLDHPLDLNWNVVEYDYLVYHLDIDRLYFDFSWGNFFSRLGKQRINWSFANVWNPLDWFNAASFFNLNYPEKPGTNALLLRYFLNPTSSLELVVEYSESWADFSSAFNAVFNLSGYDFEILFGKLDEEVAGGFGWNGGLGDGGFKGELSYFYRYPRDFAGNRHLILLSVGYDYTFSFSLSLQAEFFYHSNPRELSPLELLTTKLSVKNLVSNHYSLFFGLSYPIIPLIVYNFNFVWAVDANQLSFNDGLTFSILDNLDFQLTYQLTIDVSQRETIFYNRIYSIFQWNF